MEDFMLRVKSVIDRKIMVKGNKKGILLIETNKQQFKTDKKMENLDLELIEKLNNIGLALVMYNNGKWNKSIKASDYDSMQDKIIANVVTQKDINKDKLNETIGFLLYFINGNYLVFKTKNIKKKQKGSICDHKSLNENKSILYDSILYKVDKLKDFFNDQKDKDLFENKKSICIMQEFLLYIFNENKINNKKWFFDPVESTLSNIENL
jgi:hypothetical protein